MAEHSRNNNLPILLLPYYPQYELRDNAKLLYQVSVFLMMTLDDIFTYKETKKIAMEEVKSNGKNAKTKLSKQRIAQSKLTYFENTLMEAKKAALNAYAEDIGNTKYKQHLTKLEQMEYQII